MADTTKIDYATSTWSPLIGCTKKHTGCLNCYAGAQAGRFGVTWGPEGTRRKTSDSYWLKPLKWNDMATDRCPSVCDGNRCTKRIGHKGNHHALKPSAGWGVDEPKPMRWRVFPSLCDPFEDWNGGILSGKKDMETGDYGVAWWRNDVGVCHAGQITVGCQRGERLATMTDLRYDFFDLIDRTTNLDWLLLTKRPENIRRMWPWGWGTAATMPAPGTPTPTWPDGEMIPCPPARRDNIWLIYSASDQETLDAGLPHMLECRDLVPVLGLSLEPLVGPVCRVGSSRIVARSQASRGEYQMSCGR